MVSTLRSQFRSWNPSFWSDPNPVRFLMVELVHSSPSVDPDPLHCWQTIEKHHAKASWHRGNRCVSSTHDYLHTGNFIWCSKQRNQSGNLFQLMYPTARTGSTIRNPAGFGSQKIVTSHLQMIFKITNQTVLIQMYPIPLFRCRSDHNEKQCRIRHWLSLCYYDTTLPRISEELFLTVTIRKKRYTENWSFSELRNSFNLIPNS